MSDLELKAGSTYVFKDEKCKEIYMQDSSSDNVDYVDEYYNDGFTLDKATDDGYGEIRGSYIIAHYERELFKLKEETPQVNKDIRWAKIPNGVIPESFVEDLKLMFPDLPLESYLTNRIATNKRWGFIGFNSEEVKVFDRDDYCIKENGYEVPYQYANTQTTEEPTAEEEEAFKALEKAQQRYERVAHKGKSAALLLEKMGFKYVDGEWSF